MWYWTGQESILWVRLLHLTVSEGVGEYYNLSVGQCCGEKWLMGESVEVCMLGLRTKVFVDVFMLFDFCHDCSLR